MGTSLTGTKPKDTYDSLIKVGDNGPISGTAKYLSDGLGNDLPIAVSTSNVGIGTSTPQAKLDATRAGKATIAALDSTAFAAGVGGSIDLGGNYRSTGDFQAFTRIAAEKSNATDGNFGFDLGFYVTTNGGSTIGTKVATMTSTGVVDLAQGQIKFPATQVPSADANTLDDYEKGTFTPSITFGGASVGITYAAGRAGQYTKIGRQVTVTAYILLTSKGSSTGLARIGGLPFATGNATGYFSAGSLAALSDITYTGQIQAYAENNSTSYALNDYSEAGVQGNITDADFSNVSQIIFTATYHV